MDNLIVRAGQGRIVGLTAGLWAVDNGASIVYIEPANVLFPVPKVGDTCVLTYEYRGESRQACMRAHNDPLVGR